MFSRPVADALDGAPRRVAVYRLKREDAKPG